MSRFFARGSRLHLSRPGTEEGKRPAFSDVAASAPPSPQPQPTPVTHPAPDAGGESEAALIARRISDAGMAAPATLLLHILRPMHWLGGQALHVAQPVLESLGVGMGARDGTSSVARMARFLERDGSVDEILVSLENRPTGGSSKGKGKGDEPR